VTDAVEMLGGNGLFAALWIWSGGLFLLAVEDRADKAGG
jgi:hypothetical protein